MSEMASASLLAQAPAFAKQQWYVDNQRWEDLRLQLEQRLYGLRNWQLSWWELSNWVAEFRFHQRDEIWLEMPVERAVDNRAARRRKAARERHRR